MSTASRFTFGTAIVAGALSAMALIAPAASAASTQVKSPEITNVTYSTPFGGIAPSDYRSGYRDGYRDGFRDGRNACGVHALSRKLSKTDRGYVDGYNAGFGQAQRQCHWRR